MRSIVLLQSIEALAYPEDRHMENAPMKISENHFSSAGAPQMMTGCSRVQSSFGSQAAFYNATKLLDRP
jgi:hypothetical protein